MSDPGRPRSTRHGVSRSPRRFASRRDRKGAALIEFAVVFPLFLLLVVGAIDVGRAVMVQHKLVEAARAGSRAYSLPNEVTEGEVEAVVDTVMADANLDGYAVEFDPYPPDTIQHLAPVTVSVSIPYEQVSWGPSWFLSGRTLTGTCIMPADTGEITLDGGESPLPRDDDDDDD